MIYPTPDGFRISDPGKGEATIMCDYCEWTAPCPVGNLRRPTAVIRRDHRRRCSQWRPPES